MSRCKAPWFECKKRLIDLVRRFPQIRFGSVGLNVGFLIHVIIVTPETRGNIFIRCKSADIQVKLL